MDKKHYLTCLWPGLPELWWRGQLSALPTAVGFAIALNLLLITRFLYPLWMDSFLVWLGWWVAMALWGFWTIRSAKDLPQLIAPRQVSDEPDRFAEAHEAYLRADWETAESLLKATLAIEPRDPPALLLLTGVYRHTGRLEAAQTLLGEVTRLEVADAWWIEIRAEKKRLDHAVAVVSEALEREAA
ncbi:MAG: tetratricopeptide repeat protein [Planctomycetota bacterium]